MAGVTDGLAVSFIMAEQQKTTVVNQPKCGLAELKKVINSERMKQVFADMLGKKSVGFLTSISNIVTNNGLLQKAETPSIMLAAAQAAALDLPINPNLGYAAIVPYNDSKTKRCLAQFQIMRDGWVELALRTGQVVSIVNEPVYEGELVSRNRFKDEFVFDETKRASDKVIGYMAYIKLINGFEKTVYMTADECKAHALRYSQTYKKGFGVWVDNFDAMALKTVLKKLIKKYCPKSIEMNRALESDNASFQGDINDPENAQPVFGDDNPLDVTSEVVELDPESLPTAEAQPAPAPTPEPQPTANNEPDF